MAVTLVITGLLTVMLCASGTKGIIMQNTFKVGDKVKVVKLTHPHCESLKKEIGKEFVVHTRSSRGISNQNGDWFYNNEIELVKDEPTPQEVVSPSQVSQSQEVVSTAKEQKNHAWAVVNKATGKVEWIRQPRSVARKLAKFQNETSNHLYQVKKIEYDFV